jgi:gluconokinase
LDISVESLPEIAPPDHRFIGLTNEYALRWPQLSFARFFPAIADGAANNIGAGCVSADKAALMIGTSGAMRVLYEGEPPTELPSELWCYRADRTRVVVGGALSDGGGLYAWMKESLALNDDDESIERALGAIEPDSHGLTVLPFWAGERSSGWSTKARGAILGLTSRTRPIEILRASMEAVAYRFALIAGALDRIAPDATVVASGNALRASPVWTQMIADVLARPVSLCGLSEASTRGAALIALEAAGKIDNIEGVAIPFERVYEPDARRHARYREGLERQQKIYELIISDRDTESRSK